MLEEIEEFLTGARSGLEVRIGSHSGEVEIMEQDVGGLFAAGIPRVRS